MSSNTVFGMPIQTVFILLAVILLILITLLIITMNRLQYISRKYNTLMSGKGGKDLEHTILARFQEMDKVRSMTRKMHHEHVQFRDHLDHSFDRYGLVSFNSFDSMSGDLSFALAVMNAEKDGFVLSCMHSKEGCFVYAKDLKNGKSDRVLTAEEKKAVRIALNSRLDHSSDL